MQIYIASKFKKTLSHSGLNIVIHHKVSPELLHRTITDSETEILIWISHAGAENHGGNGLGTKGMILDYYGNDVKNFFTSPTKNLKFLGIVGCSARSIIDGFKARGNFLNRPDLEIKSYEEKVQLYTGFHETLKESLKHIGKEISENDIDENKVAIDVRFDRKEDKFIAPSWLELGDKVLAVLDNNSENYLTLSIPLSVWNQIKSKNIRFNRAKSSEDENGILPELEFQSDLGSWKVFATKEGAIIGANNKHLYIYKN